MKSENVNSDEGYLISEVRKKYSNLITEQEIEIQKLEIIKNTHIDKLNKIKRSLRSEILKIKNSDRIEKYKNIDIKKGEEFFIAFDTLDCIKMGSYRIYNDVPSNKISILIESVTPKQYSLSVCFDDYVEIDNYNMIPSLCKVINIRFNMSKLNFKDFLFNNCAEFKRAVSISDVLS